MNVLLTIVIVQFLTLVVLAWFDRVAWIRILALRQQLVVYKRKSRKPLLRNKDRLFWLLLSKIWRDWACELMLVRPETVIRWRKRKFCEFWWRKSRAGPGRSAIPEEHIDFIRRISSDHPEYGEDRIALELEVKFGIRHASSTIRRYMAKRRPGSTDHQAWRSFSNNQAKAIWSCNFFVQHSVGFRVLYIFLIMELASRKVIHLHVTDHPTLEWAKQQIRNACFEKQPMCVFRRSWPLIPGMLATPRSEATLGCFNTHLHGQLRSRRTRNEWHLNIISFHKIPAT